MVFIPSPPLPLPSLSYFILSPQQLLFSPFPSMYSIPFSLLQSYFLSPVLPSSPTTPLIPTSKHFLWAKNPSFLISYPFPCREQNYVKACDNARLATNLGEILEHKEEALADALAQNQATEDKNRFLFIPFLKLRYVLTRLVAGNWQNK